MANKQAILSTMGAARSSAKTFLSFHGSARKAQSEYYSDIQNAMDQLANPDGDGMIRMSNGKEININSLAGMTVFTTHIQLKNAEIEYLNNVYNSLKALEQKMQGLYS